MRTGALAFAVAAALSCALAAQVSTQAPSRGIAARSSEVDRKVAELTSAITWHSSLAEAQAAARTAGKPIFWMHMLGSLTGDT